jgi:hypothetical protein
VVYWFGWILFTTFAALCIAGAIISDRAALAGCLVGAVVAAMGQSLCFCYAAIGNHGEARYRELSGMGWSQFGTVVGLALGVLIGCFLEKHWYVFLYIFY